MQKVENLILGAGPAGIAAAIRLGNGTKILERNSFVGGQSASYQIGEAIFDIGGHSFHTPHPYVRDLVYNAVEMFDQVRKATCYAQGSLIPYPFQKNFRLIDNAPVVEECAAGLELVDNEKESENFEAFIFNRFGPGIAKHFMLPYNEKLWARDLKLLETNWTGERVAAPEGIKEKFDREGGKRKPLQANTVVGYPAQGGFGEIYKALAQKVEDIELGVSVIGIDFQQKIARTSGGDLFQYQNLISTIPVTELLKLMGAPVPERILERANRLDQMSLKCVMVAINHPVDTDIQRIYAADAEIPAHKTAINHNSSDWLRQRAHHGIMGEVSYSQYKQLARPDLENWFIEGLIAMGIIKSKAEVLGSKVIDVKYAYPVPKHDRAENMQNIKAFLEENDIHTLGRFGEWEYINSDEVLARGMVKGEQLAGAKI